MSGLGDLIANLLQVLIDDSGTDFKKRGLYRCKDSVAEQL